MHAHDLVAGGWLAIPRAAHGDEGVPCVFTWKAAAAVEHELHGRGVRGVAQHHGFALRTPLLLGDAAGRRALRIDAVLAIDMRPAVLLAAHDVVQLLRLLVVAEEIDAMIEAPQLAGLRLPIEANGVAQAARE